MEPARLTYFDMRGRAEAIRLFLHANQAGFEDRRIVSRDEWHALKPTLPLGGLPIYESRGILLCESHAILRHLGRLLTEAGRDEVHSAELDVAQEAIAESQEDLWRFNWVADYCAGMESYAEQTLRPRLLRLDRWFSRKAPGSRQWFGEAFSHVDCLGFCYLDEIDAFFPGVLADFAELAGLRTRVAALPGVSDYLGSTQRPLVFGMGSMGPKVDPRVTLRPGRAFPNPWSDPIDLAEVARGQRRLTSASR